MKKTTRWISILTALLLGATAQAALIITIEEVGSNVVATASGTLNLADLTTPGGGNFPNGAISPVNGWLIGGIGSYDTYNGATGGSAFGTGNPLLGDVSTGDVFGLYGDSDQIVTSTTYVSGTQIDGTVTWNNKTFASLGIDETSFTMTWGTGPTADSLTVNAAVPEPATALLFGIGGIGAFIVRRNKKAQEEEA